MTKDVMVKKVDKFLEYCFYGLIFYIPISTAIIESLSVLIIFLFVIKKILAPDFRFLINRLFCYLSLFFVFVILSLLNSGLYLKMSLMALIFKWFENVLIFIIAYDTFRNDKKRIRNAMVTFGLIGAIVCIDGLYQLFFKVDFMRHKLLQPDGITASFKNRNDFSIFISVILLGLTSFFFVDSWLKKIRLLAWPLVFLLLINLILSYSRSAWLAVVAGLFYLLFFLKKRLLIILFILVSFCFIFIPVLTKRDINIFQTGGDGYRTIIWGTAVSIIKENPFLGKGLGTFMEYFSKYSTGLSPQYAHNCFLQIWAETGLFSLISFLLFLYYIFYKGTKKLKENKDNLLLGLLTASFGSIVHSFFDTDLYSVQVSIIFWVLLGLTSAKIFQKESE